MEEILSEEQWNAICDKMHMLVRYDAAIRCCQRFIVKQGMPFLEEVVSQERQDWLKDCGIILSEASLVSEINRYFIKSENYERCISNYKRYTGAETDSFGESVAAIFSFKINCDAVFEFLESEKIPFDHEGWMRDPNPGRQVATDCLKLFRHLADHFHAGKKFERFAMLNKMIDELIKDNPDCTL